MPQKRSTYGDIITTHTETDIQEPQAATTTGQQHEEQNTAVEETQLEEDSAPEVNTPLPLHRSNVVPVTVRARHRKMTINKPPRFVQPLPLKDCVRPKKQTKKKVKLTLKR